MRTCFLAWALLTGAAAWPLAAAEPEAVGPATQPAASSLPEVTFTLGEPAGPVYVPEPNELARLVQRLNDDDYHARQAATEQLSDLSAAALPAIKKALAEGPKSPETDARAAAIVQSLEAKGWMDKMIGEAKASHIPVYVGADPAIIALDNTVIMQIIPLRSLPPRQLAIDLGPLVSADARMGATPAGSTMNALVITDTSAKINRLVQIIQKLDAPPRSPLKLEYKQLQFTNAVDAARLINAMFNPAGAGGPLPMPAPGARGGAAAPPTGRLSADSDARTNTVILNGPPEQVRQAIDMLDKLEAAPADVSVPAGVLKPDPDGSRVPLGSHGWT